MNRRSLLASIAALPFLPKVAAAASEPATLAEIDAALAPFDAAKIAPVGGSYSYGRGALFLLKDGVSEKIGEIKDVTFHWPMMSADSIGPGDMTFKVVDHDPE